MSETGRGEKVDDYACNEAELTTTPAVVPTNPAPVVVDGGIRAWFQVLGSFLLWCNLWGYTFAYGNFQNYYEQTYLVGTSSSAISWIGSIQSFLLIISGVWTGPLFDLGYYKSMMFAGATLSTLGAFMLSLSTKYWQIFLTQGLCIGFGCGILFVPSVALVSRSFVRRRSIAVGIMTCGAPVGALIYAVMFERLLPRLGFAWMTRVMGIFMLGTYALSFPLLLWGAKNTGSIGTGTKRRLFDKAALTDLPFWAYALATTTTFMAYLSPFFYMPTYAQVVLGTTQSSASYSLIVSQASSILGRLLASVAANYIGVMIPWIVCAFVPGIMCLAWIGITTWHNFLVYCAIYGCFSGALVSLPPSVFPIVCPDSKVLGTRLGMAQSISSIANLIGPPIAGALLRAANPNGHNFLGVQLWSGLVLLLGSCELGLLWLILVKKRNTKLLV